MFTQQYELLSRRPVNFNGNDGDWCLLIQVLCLERTADITDHKEDQVVWCELSLLHHHRFLLHSY